MKSWPYCYKYWNFDLILPNTGMLLLSFQSLEFWSYTSKHWNSAVILRNLGILGLLINFGILTLSFQTLEFWAYFYTYRFSYPILSNSGILALFVLALELLSYPCKHCNSDVILPNTGILPNFFKHWILILSFQTLEFWPCPYKPWNYDLFFQKNIGLLTLFL